MVRFRKACYRLLHGNSRAERALWASLEEDVFEELGFLLAGSKILWRPAMLVFLDVQGLLKLLWKKST
jgi:hypothetical protein